MIRAQTEALEKRYDGERSDGAGVFRPMRKIPDYKEASSTYSAELDRAVATTVDWYKLLVATSNLVFQIEYWSRVNP
jgi:hypothetical protein